MTHRDDRTTPGSPVSTFDSITVFTFLWAAGILGHEAYHRQFVFNWHDGLLITAAIAALLRPSSLARLVALNAALLVEVTVEMPLVVNHWLLAGLAALTILVVLAARPGWRTDGSWDRAALYHALAPPLRLVILLTYTFAFVAKLNWDFLDPVMSCANMLYPWMARRIGLLPTAEWTRPAVIGFTLFAEGAIPALLLFRRTRVAGAVFAFVFHIMLGLAGFHDFSGIATAFLVLFLPDDLPARLQRLVPVSGVALASGRAAHRWIRTPAFVPLAVAAGYALMRNRPSGWSALSFSMALWFPAAIVMLAVALRALQAGAWPSPASHLAVARPVWLLGPLLVLLNGLSPYVGLKTEHSFVMFSNLMTEGPYWNHMLLPRGMRVFGLQDDLVLILDSSERRIRRYAERRRVIVDYAFHWLVSHYPDASVVYERNGERFEVRRIGDDPVLARRPGNALTAKILLFSPVRARCSH